MSERMSAERLAGIRAHAEEVYMHGASYTKSAVEHAQTEMALLAEIERLGTENARLRAELEAADARWEETASDGTDYTLTHSDGIYAVADAGGHVLCEFMRGATENGGANEVNAEGCT